MWNCLNRYLTWEIRAWNLSIECDAANWKKSWITCIPNLRVNPGLIHICETVHEFPLMWDHKLVYKIKDYTNSQLFIREYSFFSLSTSQTSFLFFNNSIISTLPKLGITQRRVQQRLVAGIGNFDQFLVNINIWRWVFMTDL